VICLDAIVLILLAAMPCRWQQLLQHARVDRCLVGGDLAGRHLRHVDGPLEEPAGRLEVPVCRREDVDDLAELVDGAVDVPPPASDPDVGLVHLPAVPDAMPARLGGVGQ
jgi:hypothetical protein